MVIYGSYWTDNHFPRLCRLLIIKLDVILFELLSYLVCFGLIIKIKIHKLEVIQLKFYGVFFELLDIFGCELLIFSHSSSSMII